MELNLELLKPKLNCWWEATSLGRITNVKITVVNSGQAPDLINSVSVRPPKNVSVNINEENKAIVEGKKTTCLTPSTIILGGEKKYIECETIQDCITSVSVGIVHCSKINQSIIIEEVDLSD